MLFLITLLTFGTLVHCQETENPYELTILHYNDFHARFEETSPSGSPCDRLDPCIGGLARLATAVRKAQDREPNNLFLNAGDSFQGTIWYNLMRWNVTQEFMNMLPHDAHALGNHEFDHGIEGLVPYIRHLKAPVVAANIIDKNEPTIQGIYKPSIVVNRNGRKIGIIGVLISSTPDLASTGHLEFADEIDSVRSEAEKLNGQGVDIIIVLSHCGLNLDREIAEKGGPHIDIIVGGHSHTLLYTGEPPDTTAFTPGGPYPIVVDQKPENRKVLIVQAGAHTVYLGEIKLKFDIRGNIVAYAGNPHYLGNEIPQAPDILAKIAEYKPTIDELAKRKIGSSIVHLSSNCACTQCNLGGFICEAMLHGAMELAQNGSWGAAHFCAINQGGVRADMVPGDLTYEAAILAQPFENNIEKFELRGDHIIGMLEFSAINEPWPGNRNLQFAGLRVHFDGRRQRNDRVVSVEVRCIECDVPRYEPLDEGKYYTVVMQSFLAEGGDGFNMIAANRRNVEVIGVDYDFLIKYIENQTPVFSDVDGRLHIDSPCIEEVYQ